MTDKARVMRLPYLAKPVYDQLQKIANDHDTTQYPVIQAAVLAFYKLDKDEQAVFIKYIQDTYPPIPWTPK